MPLDCVLELKVNEEVLVQRLAGRGRADDEANIIRLWLSYVSRKNRTSAGVLPGTGDIGYNQWDRNHGRSLRGESVRHCATSASAVVQFALPERSALFTHIKKTCILVIISIYAPPQSKKCQSSKLEITTRTRAHAREGLSTGAHQLITRMVRPGITTLEIDNAVEAYFAKHGAIPLFKGVPGRIPSPASLLYVD